MSVKEICKYFWKLEKRHVLLADKELQERWIPFRFKFYYFVTEQTGIFEKAHPLQLSLIDKIIFGLKAILNIIHKTPFLIGGTPKNILIPHPRKIQGQDLYSTYVLECIDDLAIIDTRQQGEMLPGSKSFDFYFVLFSSLSKLYARVFAQITPINYIIKRTLEKFSEQFQIDFKESRKLYVETIIRFYLLKRIYGLFFKIKKVERLYIVGAYFRMEVLAAAKDVGVEVVELQHGTITPYHLGYSYPEKSDITFFPDKLFCFGAFWFENTPMPKETEFKIVGAPFIEKLKGHILPDADKEFAVVVNSQGVIGSMLFEFAYRIALLEPSLRVIFRLHPSEKLEKYTQMLEGKQTNVGNFEISAVKPNIFELMGSVQFVSGVFSTTVFEAMYLGARIILIDGVGIEYMEPVIDRDEAVLVYSPEEFVEKYKKSIKSDAEYYYANIPRDRACSLFD